MPSDFTSAMCVRSQGSDEETWFFVESISSVGALKKSPVKKEKGKSYFLVAINSSETFFVSGDTEYCKKEHQLIIDRMIEAGKR